MADDNGRERPEGGEKVDAPERWRCHGEVDHGGDTEKAPYERVLELLEDLAHFFKKVGFRNLFGGSAPAHVNGEHVAEQRLTDVQR